MSEQEQLDWLARNVSEWPITPVDGFVPGSNYYGQNQKGIVYCNGGITKDQWKTRRSELINKPSWDDAPDWAEYLRQTCIGKWYWCESDQKNNNDGVRDAADNFSVDRNDESITGEPLDWKNSLEKRPDEYTVKEEEFKPTHTITSVIDNKSVDCVINYQSNSLIVYFDGKCETVISANVATITPYKTPKQKQLDKIMDKWREECVDHAHDSENSTATVGYVLRWMLDNYEIEEKK